MRRYTGILCASLLACLAIGSCADDDYTELDKGSTELAIQANASDLTLQEISHNENALELSWTTGTNFGSGNKIYYTVDIAEAGTSFASPVTVVDSTSQTYSWSVTTEALNSFLTEHFGTQPGLRYALEARVRADVTGIGQQQTATTSFNATGYVPVTSTLFINGTATDGQPEAMQRDDTGQFSATCRLKAGTFTLTTTENTSYPAYVLSDEGTLVLQEQAGQNAGKPIEVKADHYYNLKANLLTGELQMDETSGVTPAYEQIYLVGDATGWSFEPMWKDALDPFLFRTGRVFLSNGSTKSEFKFATANNSWENMYKAGRDAAPYTDTQVQFVKGFDPDPKWTLTEGEMDRAYKICLDIRAGKERMLMKPFTPYPGIWLVGSAAPGGWSLDAAAPMTASTADPYVMTWSGKLNVGELKFSCDLKSDWNGAWFMPSAEAGKPTGQEEHVLFIDKSGEDFKGQYPDTNIAGVDYKWNITEAGNYTITLNQLTETITIQKR